MEIVSLAHSMYAADGVTPDMADQLWDAYWSGQSVNALRARADSAVLVG